MNIISFIDGHTASAALFSDNELKACVSEERFSRKKCQMGYPRSSIDYCLSLLGGKSLDWVLVNGKQPPDPMAIRIAKSTTFSVKDFIELQHRYYGPILMNGQPQKVVYREYFEAKLKEKEYPDSQYDGMSEMRWTFDPKTDAAIFRDLQIKTIVDHLKVDPKKIIFIEHHPAHAAYAYFASSFRGKDALVFTLDGIGENVNATISIARNDSLKEVFRTSEANIGRLWKHITLLLAMKPEQHEYKVMGLAPYANEKYVSSALKIFEENFIHIDGIEFKYRNRPKDMYFSFAKLLEGQRFDAVAGGLQLYTEKIISGWIKNAVKRFGIPRAVFSGGVSMNIKLNKAIAELPEVEEFYVAPSGGDESLAMGVFYKHLGTAQMPHLENIYLGPEYSHEDILKAVNRYKDKYAVSHNIKIEELARFLADGFIIARFDGRMEFGARALGNRSILGDPSKTGIVKKINTQIKNRDFWMPFTPTILEARQRDYIINPKDIPCPFMTMAFDSTGLARKELAGAMHPYDYTIRPQLLSEKQNSAYYRLIKEFEKITGIGGVLNTSFNLHGEPIVCSPEDAMHTFDNSALDMLVMGNVLVRRKRHGD